MSKVKDKHFIGTWVDAQTKEQIKSIAAASERSLNYTQVKLLRLGVKHLKSRKLA